MRTQKVGLVWLASLILAAVIGAGCSRAPEGEQSSAGDQGKKSGGFLSKLVETTTPVAVPEGTAIEVTLDQSLASNQSRSGDEFAATVSQAVVVNGKTVIPKGASVHGRVVEARESGRLKGVALLRLTLEAVEVGGTSHDIQTTSISRSGGDHKKRNIAFIGGGTAAGATIGAIAGGGKGAVIGGAVGAGAGTATAAATGKKDITLPTESSLSFKLTQPVTIPVKS